MKKPVYLGDYVRWKYVKDILPKGKGKCLDLGCGSQEYKEMIESKGYSYLGVDLHPRFEGIQKENAEDLTFKDNSFDVVIFIDVLEHINDPGKVFSEVCRVLKSGGCFIVHTPNSEQTHILVQPVEQEDHVRKGFTFGGLWKLFEMNEFFEIVIIPSFDEKECLAWELVYSHMNKININPLDIIEFDYNKYANLGWMGRGGKP